MLERDKHQPMQQSLVSWLALIASRSFFAFCVSAVFVLNDCVAMVGPGELREEACSLPVTDSGLIYVYNEQQFHLRDLLDSCDDPGAAMMQELPTGGYTAVADHWIGSLQASALRTDKAEDAKWFLIPFNLDRSFYIGDCKGTTHAQRINAVLDAVEESPYYLQKAGADHVLVCMYWSFFPGCKNCGYFPEERRIQVKNMVIGRYLDYHLHLDGHMLKNDPHYGFTPKTSTGMIWWEEGEDWRCTLSLPVLTSRSLTMQLASTDLGYASWSRRRYTLFYRGHGSKRCARDAEQLHDEIFRVAQHLPKESNLVSNDHATTPEQYAQEISNSKFCLVLRCDDPHTSRFVDAVAAGCIPVIISDGFHLVVAPFPRVLNYAGFSVTIPESMWLKDSITSARFAYNWPTAVTKQLHRGLMEARPTLIWRAGDKAGGGFKSRTGDALVEQLDRDCSPR
jgi:hypothetical protein